MLSWQRTKARIHLRVWPEFANKARLAHTHSNSHTNSTALSGAVGTRLSASPQKMDLSQALDGVSPSGAGTQSAGSMAWPQQPNRPGAPANPVWGGGQNQPAAGSGGAAWWPGQQPTAGGAGGGPGQWPGGQPAAGGAGGGPGQWPGQQPAAGGAGGGPGQWPAQQPAAGGGPGQWPGGQPAAGGAGGGPGQWPGQQPAAGGAGGGAGQWPGGQPPAAGGGQWPSPSKGTGDWPAPSPGTAASTSLTVPYSQKIPNGLRSGSVIHIKGSIKPKADKVTVDLSTDSDLVFHFNPRFNESGRKVIVRNSKIGGRWGREERDLSRFPFTAGQPFELKIDCTSSTLVVSVQGSHLLHFKHRGGSPGEIRRLDICNDLSLSHVSIE